MSDPSLDLQEAIIQRLRTDVGVTAFVAQRIFDQVPAATPFPYISYGSDQILQDDVTCITAYEASVQIDVWSRANGQPEMKRIAGAVRAALHAAEFDLAEHGLVLIEHEQTRYLQDPDGLTSHGALTFRALVDAETGIPFELWGDESGGLELWGDHSG